MVEYILPIGAVSIGLWLWSAEDVDFLSAACILALICITAKMMFGG